MAPRGGRLSRVLLPRRGERALPALSGLLLVLAQPPFHLLVVPFVALVPWALWTASLPGGPNGARAALRGGLLLGFVHHGLVLHWLPGAFLWFTPLAPLAHLAVVATLAGLSGLAARALHFAVVRRGAPLWLALPAVWTVLEWIPSLPGDFAFPWLGLGVSLTAVPELLWPAELGGVLAVTFWIVLVNGLASEAVLRARRSRARARAPLLLLLPAILLPAGWGFHRAQSLELERVGRIAVLRLPLPQTPRGDRTGRAREAARDAEAALSALEPGSVDLVVWPEATFPLFLDRSDGAPFLEEVGRHAARLKTPQLVGAYLAEGGPVNALVLVDADGVVTDSYAKRRLVPGVEGLPAPLGRLPGGRPVGGARPGEGFRRGEGATLEDPGGLVVGGLVCWEALFPGAAREARASGALLLANGSNDSFLEVPGAGSWTGWAARRQHEAHLVLRAVETRTGAARAATAGGAFLVDPVGRVQARAPEGAEGRIAVAEVAGSPTLSLHTRVGVGTGPPALLLLLVLAWAGGRSGTRDGGESRTRE